MTQRTRSSRILASARPYLRRKTLLRGGTRKSSGREPLVAAFYAWSESACMGPEGESLEGQVARHKTQLRSFRDLRERAVLEVATAVWLNHAVVAGVPLFARARGRLLSDAEGVALISGLLREAGLEVQRVGVWRGEGIQVATLLRLCDGRELLVNDQEPSDWAGL
ncbi:MAG: hypothetical protein C4327_03775 [Meiothermus sp.]